MGRIANFGDVPEEYSVIDRAEIVILPVPYDRTSTWIKGADKGPQALIEASTHMELYDIETDSEVYRRGIHTAEPVAENGLPEDMVEVVEKRVKHYIDNGKFVVVVGGEHSVSLGPVRAHVAQDADITVLQLDAHSDLRNEYEGSEYNHACIMARIRQLCPIVQVGIRSMDISEKTQLDESRIFFAEDIRRDKNWKQKVLSKLSNKVYITIDLDVFDPSIMPSTGTPEPGGLLWYEVLVLLKAVFDDKEVVGIDIVELCPIESNKAPDFLAAKLVYKLLSYKFKGMEE
ncbi:MAG: agmatinase [Sedimentisphaerales bacterium]|nr:agmatinase [Sedimentisphaerales bacterium]